MNDDLVGLIPAAGKGVRLGLPYPKELYPIISNNHYKPISQYVVENILTSGVSHIVFVVNETKHQLMGYFGSGKRFGCTISYVVQESRGEAEESTSPGLSHALDSAYHLIRGKNVVFGMADTIMEPKDVFRRLLDASHPDDSVILGLFDVSRPEKFGMVELDGAQIVKRIIDKPTETDLNHAWGCITWKPDFTEFLHHAVNHQQESDFAIILNNAISDGMQIRGVVLPESNYIDLGTYEEIVELDKKFRG